MPKFGTAYIKQPKQYSILEVLDMTSLNSQML
jgi:hypothetical protein